MPNRKLSALTELAATPATNDEIYIRDVSEAPSAESKRITIANLINALEFRLVQVMTGSADMSNSPSIDTPTKAWS